MTGLRTAAWAFAVLQVTHALDHVVHLDSNGSAELGLLATTGGIATVVLLVLIGRGSPHAAEVATVVGFGAAAGFFAVHVLPEWGLLSDPYADVGGDAIDWILLALPFGAGLWVGVEGMRLRAGGSLDQASSR